MKSFPKQKKGTQAITLKRSFHFLNEIDLDDINVDKKILHKNLNQKIWDDFEIKEDVRKKLIEISNQFYGFLDIKVKPTNILFTGSLANYNYSEFSDIDVHLEVDYSKISEDHELVNEFFFTKSTLWELKHDIKVNGFPVQLFVQDISKESRKSSGIFSLTKDEWIQKPSYENFEVDTETLKRKIKKFVDKIELLDINKITPEKLYAHAKKLKDEINRMRQSGLDANGEYSLENLAFKYLRNNKYIDRLKDLISKSFDKIYSLNN